MSARTVDRPTPAPATNDDKVVRLSVNLSLEAASALKGLASFKGISVTEAIRRAIAVWKFVEDESARGNRIAVIERDRDGKEQIREVVLL